MQKTNGKFAKKKHGFLIVLDKEFFDEIGEEARRDNRSKTNYILNCVKREIVKKREGINI